ncbi:hypothetical protein [Cupriavidus campinensis]|nr:hypothetical protein [Cupriavidus campinensis]
MIHPDDEHYLKFRAWQQRNRNALYIGAGTLGFALLIANIIQIWKGLK